MLQELDPHDISISERKRSRIPFRLLPKAQQHKFYRWRAIHGHERAWPADMLEQEVFAGEAWARTTFDAEGSFPVYSGTSTVENCYWIFGWADGFTNDTPLHCIGSCWHRYRPLEEDLRRMGLI
jgi:hypothetical protein